jgi:hypothetical protein
VCSSDLVTRRKALSAGFLNVPQASLPENTGELFRKVDLALIPFFHAEFP